MIRVRLAAIYFLSRGDIYNKKASSQRKIGTGLYLIGMYLEKKEIVPFFPLSHTSPPRNRTLFLTKEIQNAM